MIIVFIVLSYVIEIYLWVFIIYIFLLWFFGVKELFFGEFLVCICELYLELFCCFILLFGMIDIFLIVVIFVLKFVKIGLFSLLSYFL